PLLEGAIHDLRAALKATPTVPYPHEHLGWAYATVAMIDPERRAAAIPFALASLQRAVALQPANAYLRASLAFLALQFGDPYLQTALDSGRGAIERDPALIEEVTTHFLPLPLTVAQWANLVPDSGLDRLELGTLLEASGLVPEAADEYQRAAQLLPRGESVFARWALAQLLMRQGDPRAALSVIEKALQLDPENPELRLAQGAALAQLDADPLIAYRAAVQSAEARGSAKGGGPFEVRSPRAQALVARAPGRDAEEGVARYHRA